jgi:hypothetical protein
MQTAYQRGKLRSFLSSTASLEVTFTSIRHAIRYIEEGYSLVFSRSAVKEGDADSKKKIGN